MFNAKIDRTALRGVAAAALATGGLAACVGTPLAAAPSALAPTASATSATSATSAATVNPCSPCSPCGAKVAASPCAAAKANPCAAAPCAAAEPNPCAAAANPCAASQAG